MVLLSLSEKIEKIEMVTPQVLRNFQQRLNVKIGPENGPDKFFYMNSYNYKTTLPGMDPNDCHASLLNTTEGVFFPQNLSKTTTLKLMHKVACRPVDFNFEEEVQIGPILGYKYKIMDDICDRNECDQSSSSLPDGLCDFAKCFYGRFFVFFQRLT